MTNKKDNLIPKLRFPEFKNDGEWGQKLVKDVCSIETGKSNTQDQDVNGLYPFFIRSENPVKSNKYLYDCESVITIGDGKIGQVFHYINGKFDLHQRCYKMSDFHGVDGKYFFYFFSSHFYERAMRMSAKATVDSVRLEMISEMPIYLPSLKEQKRIAFFLTSLDDLLSGTKAKLERLKAHKKGLTQKLFPAPGKTLPEYRFPGFEEGKAWEVKCLGDVTTLVNRRNKSRRILPIYSINNKQGFILQSEQFSGLDSSSRGYDTSLYKIVNSNLFAYNPARINVGSIGYSGRIKEGIISSLYVCFKSSDAVLDDFLRCFFETDQFRRSVDNNVEGGIRNYLFYENFSRIRIALPTIDEQKHIASSLRSINDLIEKYENELVFIENHRQGLMQQLFPKNAL